MNTWIVGKDLMKHHCLIKKLNSSLNMENITDVNYGHAKRVFNGVALKSLNDNLGDYHDLHV